MDKTNLSKCQSIYDRYLQLIENYDHNKTEIDKLSTEAKKCGCSNVEEKKSVEKQLLEKFFDQLKKINARQKQITA